MNPSKTTARIAGVLYLFLIILGVFSLMYVPGKIIDWSNPEVTAENIIIFGSLFKAGFIANVLSNITWLFLAFAFRELFLPVNKKLADLIVIFVLAGTIIMCISALNQYAVMQLLSGKKYLDVFDTGQLHALSMFFIELYYGGDLIASIFFGLWLLPLGYLTYKSEYLPRILGVFLMIGCFGYLGEFFGRAFFPGYYSSGIDNFIALPADAGELGICFWLLIRGVKSRSPDARKSK